MAYPRKIRNYNCFVDGVGYFGKIAEATMPELALTTADHRGGGMDAPVNVDMGMEALEAELKFAEFLPEVMGMFGTRQRIVLRGGAMGEADFQADSLVFTLRGRFTKHGQDNFTGGNDVMLIMGAAVDQFRVELNGQVIHDIDVEAGKRVIDGNDQLASMRLAMGL